MFTIFKTGFLESEKVFSLDRLRVPDVAWWRDCAAGVDCLSRDLLEPAGQGLAGPGCVGVFGGEGDDIRGLGCCLRREVELDRREAGNVRVVGCLRRDLEVEGCVD